MTAHRDRIKRLGELLRDLHRSFPAGDKTVAVHLFGIRHGPEMRDLARSDLDAIAVAAGLKTTFGSELRKMVKLSEFVVAK